MTWQTQNDLRTILRLKRLKILFLLLHNWKLIGFNTVDSFKTLQGSLGMFDNLHKETKTQKEEKEKQMVTLYKSQRGKNNGTEQVK